MPWGITEFMLSVQRRRALVMTAELTFVTTYIASFISVTHWDCQSCVAVS